MLMVGMVWTPQIKIPVYSPNSKRIQRHERHDVGGCRVKKHRPKRLAPHHRQVSQRFGYVARLGDDGVNRRCLKGKPGLQFSGRFGRLPNLAFGRRIGLPEVGAGTQGKFPSAAMVACIFSLPSRNGRSDSSVGPVSGKATTLCGVRWSHTDQIKLIAAYAYSIWSRGLKSL